MPVEHRNDSRKGDKSQLAKVAELLDFGIGTVLTNLQQSRITDRFTDLATGRTERSAVFLVNLNVHHQDLFRRQNHWCE